MSQDGHRELFSGRQNLLRGVRSKLTRCRFTAIEVPAITALGFSFCDNVLAVGRVDGSLEFYRNMCRDTSEKNIEAWSLESIGIGTKIQVPECLVWTSGNRLFTAGPSGDIIEWDILKCVHLSITPSTGGSVWALAASEQGLLVSACFDSTLKIWRTESKLTLIKTIPLFMEGRILSLTMHPESPIVAAGSADGQVRVVSLEGTEQMHMSVAQVGGQMPHVWALVWANEFVLVSGDSSGTITFFDSRNGAQLSVVKAHEADVLALASCPFGVLASGVDPLIALLSEFDGGWVLDSRRIPMGHTHDVRGLSVCSKKNENWSILASGGLDSRIVLTLVDNSNSNNFKTRSIGRMNALMRKGLVSLSRSGRNVSVLGNSHSIRVWQLEGPVCELEVILDDKRSIGSFCLSENGTWLAVLYDSCLLKIFFKDERWKDISLIFEDAMDSICCKIEPLLLKMSEFDGFQWIWIAGIGGVALMKLDVNEVKYYVSEVEITHPPICMDVHGMYSVIAVSSGVVEYLEFKNESILGQRIAIFSKRRISCLKLDSRFQSTKFVFIGSIEGTVAVVSFSRSFNRKKIFVDSFSLSDKLFYDGGIMGIDVYSTEESHFVLIYTQCSLGQIILSPAPNNRGFVITPLSTNEFRDIFFAGFLPSSSFPEIVLFENPISSPNQAPFVRNRFGAA